MSIDLQMEREDLWAVARLSGDGTAHELTRLYPQILQECRRGAAKRLLVDLTLVRASISTTDRFDLGEKAAIFTREGIVVAAVAAPEHVDPARFGELVAKNRGLTIRVFTDAQAAKDWLRMQPAGG